MVDDDELCNHFTHYADTGECYTFFHCESFSQTTCDDCVSGKRYCDDKYLCNLPGQVNVYTVLFICSLVCSYQFFLQLQLIDSVSKVELRALRQAWRLQIVACVPVC